MDIDRIICQAKEGDVQSFEILYKRFRDTILNYVIGLGTLSEDAEEICDDVFVHIFQNFEVLKCDAEEEVSHLQEDFKNYLYQVARWKVYDFRKKEKAGKRIPKKKTRSIENAHELQVSSNKMNETDHIEAEDKMEALKMLLNKLSFEERDLLVLHHFEERTYTEIAQIMKGKKLSGEELSKMATALRKRVSRIHDKLRRIVENEPLLKELFAI